MMKLIYSFFVALPELLALLKTIIKNIEDARVDRKVKEDLAAIHKAFKEKDAKALSDIFNS